MKKLLFSLGLAVVTVTAIAQEHLSQSFLNVRALNTGTNIWGVTNLAKVFHFGMIYNPTNATYTNNAGTYVGTSTTYLGYIGTTNTSTAFPIFKDVSLWSDRNGNLPVTYLPGNTVDTNWVPYSAATIFVEWVNPLASNAPMGIVFRPVWDGATPSYATNELWGFRIPGLAVSKYTFSTNVPLWQWPGAKGLAVVAITNQFILGGVSAQTNSTFITKLQLNGFRP